MPPANDSLAAYRAKRSPDRTPEPFGSGGSATGRLFVVQKHAARNLHYDLRLELDGVLKSWAVPKDPSYDQSVKRAAFHVEDHPLEYAEFEGVIPKGNYGAGAVIVWDSGTWLPLEDPGAGLEKGKLLFELHGHKLRGRWTLVKTKRGENEWLLIKERDAFEGTGRDTFTHDSVFTGRTLEDLAAGRAAGDIIRAELSALDPPRRRVHPRDVELMLAATRPRPFDDPDWVFELKYDGYRLLAARAGDEVTLHTRNRNELSRGFPDVVRALARLTTPVFLLDAEVVVNDERGVPSFQRLQQRARLTREPDVRRAAAALPATLYVFDLLAFEDRDLRPLPLLERKRLLRTLLPGTGVLRYSEHMPERGSDLFAVAEDLGMEGIIGKRAHAPYRAGRSHDWVKIRAQRTDDFVAIGLRASKNAPGTFGSLHVATYADGDLVYAGAVGTGLTPAQVDEFLARAAAHERADPPLAAVTAAPGDRWFDPAVVIEVRYLERTEAGQLRHPVFLRFRDDRSAVDLAQQAEPVAGLDTAVSVAVDPRASAEPDRPASSFVQSLAADAGAADPDDDEGRSSGADVRAPAARAAAGGAHAVDAADAAVQDARVVRFTNLDKVLWPEDGYTKGQLIEYYRAVADWLLPYLRDRPVVLTRFPDGIHGKSFFQKDAPAWSPGWLRTETVWSEGSERELRYFVCDDLPTLLYLANSATIPLHVWASRVGALERPDWCSLDLDPKGAPFADVVRVARALHELCEDIGLPSFVKTSGSSGLHVLIPLAGQCTHEQARLLGELLARQIAHRLPAIATVARVISQRQGRVYLDYLQNGHGKLLVSPLCVRPLPGAPVSTPLRWSDVNARLDPRKHDIRSVPRRLRRLRDDPLAAVLERQPDLLAALGALHALQDRDGRV